MLSDICTPYRNVIPEILYMFAKWLMNLWCHRTTSILVHHVYIKPGGVPDKLHILYIPCWWELTSSKQRCTGIAGLSGSTMTSFSMYISPLCANGPIFGKEKALFSWNTHVNLHDHLCPCVTAVSWDLCTLIDEIVLVNAHNHSLLSRTTSSLAHSTLLIVWHSNFLAHNFSILPLIIRQDKSAPNMVI